MGFNGFETRFCYTNKTTSGTVANDPDNALGGFPPSVAQALNSEPYRSETLDATSTELTVVTDTETDDGGGGTDPEVGDWFFMANGPAGGSYGKITAVDYGTGAITLDRALSALPQSGDGFRTSKKNNVFPDVTADESIAGTEDFRTLCLYHADGTLLAPFDNNFRFWILPIKPNGCDVKIVAGGDPNSFFFIETMADGKTSPFNLFGKVESDNVNNLNDMEFANANEVRTTPSLATPDGGGGDALNNDFLPIYLNRVIPPGATSGECVFALMIEVDDAVAQDAGADPNPFVSGFIFSWTIPQITYQTTLVQDRLAYTRGGTRITATVTDTNDVPVPNLNCWLVVQSGPGTINTDFEGLTDANGQITGIYNSPDTISTDPVIRLVIPSHTGF